MKRVARNVGIGIGGLLALLALLALSVGTFCLVSQQRQARRYTIDVGDPSFDITPEAVVEGERLYVTRGCGDCHGLRGEGLVVMDAPPGLFAGPNLTRLERTDAQLVRSIRHGVGVDGAPLLLMPSEDFWGMSDTDVGRIVAFLRSLPPTPDELPHSELRPLGRVLHVLGLFPALAAERIDHAAPRPQDVAVGPTIEYGRYLAAGCTGCHGLGYSGGPIPGAPPELGTPRNLTPHESGLAAWTEEDFTVAMRTGRTPKGPPLNPQQMPYPSFSRMTDVELQALYRFLRSVPARPSGQR